MTRPDIEQIVDRCIDAILQGRMTVDACLRAWPEDSAELEPLLRAALRMLEAPEPQVTPNPARRAMLMAAIETTPQESPRRGFRIPVLPGLTLPTLAFGALPRFAMVAGGATVLFVLILGVSLLRGSGTATASAATLTVFAGGVEALENDGWLALADGADLAEGDSIRTGVDGRALVTFGDGSTASLEPGTTITLTRLIVGDARQIEIGQASGRLWNDVADGAEASYLVRTPHALVEAHGTVFETVVDNDTSVATAEGSVQVVTPSATVDVLRGQVVRATAEALGQPEDAPLIGEITIVAPMAGTVTDRDGAATGILPTGVVVQQVPGVSTTDVADGLQHLFVGSVRPGVYSLWLRRFEAGDGLIVIETPAGRTNIPVAADVNSARIRLAIDIVDGVVFMRTLDTELELDAPEPDVRVVETDRSRDAVDLSDAVEDRPAVVEDALRESEHEDADWRWDGWRDDGRGDDRGGRDGGSDRGRGDENGRPNATPTATATATSRIDGDRGSGRGNGDDGRDGSFESRLRAAIDAAVRGNETALQATLERLLDGDRDGDEERLDDLADAMERDGDARAIVIAVVSTDGAPGFTAELPDALDRVSDRLRDRIERLLGDVIDVDLGIADRRDGAGLSSDDRDGRANDDDRDGDDDGGDRGGRWWWN